MPIKIITTEDGSHSLFDDELNETYHSTRGARGESDHVFIKAGLEHFKKERSQAIHILEIGLGTGLNAFLTAQYAQQNRQLINFTSLEPYPISEEVYTQLNFNKSEAERELFLTIHQSDWEKEVEIAPMFKLHKAIARLEEFATSSIFDLIYFDAFAPSKQPEVWSLGNIQKCYQLLKPGGILTSYCAQGQFKRNLKEAKFEVETLQGAMGKKEMVRAIKN